MTGRPSVPFLLLLLAAAPGPAWAQDPPARECGPGRQTTPIDLNAAFSGRDARVRHLWGRANVESRPRDPSAAGPVLRVAYPQGSLDPGNPAAPRGGAGFMLYEGRGAERGCLAFRVRFPQGFAFAKGGKLPGLFGGDAPRGCTPEEVSHGFSARLMWRGEGAGELYLYGPGRSSRCGESIGRGAWTFEPGAWTSIAEEVVMNTPGAADGTVRVWVNGRLVIDQGGIVLRERPGVGVDGLLFATFFGGHDKSWASPVAQYAEFADFSLSLGSNGRK